MLSDGLRLRNAISWRHLRLAIGGYSKYRSNGQLPSLTSVQILSSFFCTYLGIITALMAEFGLESRPLCTPSSDIYKYTPVDSEANEIRVAHILPGSKNDPLLCQLKNVLLCENPTFEALSYTWGTQTDCVEISIDGKKASISENLNSALRRLRLADKVLTIWVDSICINQDDLVERSAQASRMRFIYRQACSVSVWLGNEDEEKEDGVLAFTLLQDLDMASEENFNDIVGPTRFIQLEALKRLFRRPYW